VARHRRRELIIRIWYQVVIMIDDRGPFIRGRVIDLSMAAARRLGIARSGVVPVRIKVVRWAEEPEA
jgi:rare lipoprotein A